MGKKKKKYSHDPNLVWGWELHVGQLFFCKEARLSFFIHSQAHTRNTYAATAVVWLARGMFAE